MEDVFKFISPSILTIISSKECSASCPSCCFGCSPNSNIWVDFNVANKFIDDALDLYPSIKVLVITGGECTIKWESLKQLIEHGREKGLIVRIVTNAHWAISRQITRTKMEELVSSGLKELNISTGDEHLRYVDINNVINAIGEAIRLSITCVVNIEHHKDSDFSVNDFLNRRDVKDMLEKDKFKHVKVQGGIWVKPSEYKYQEDCENTENGCDSILSSIVLDPQHNLLSCCGLSVSRNKFLKLGVYRSKRDLELYRNVQYEDLLKLWIFSEGASNVLSQIRKNMGIHKKKSKHMCIDCLELFTNKIYIDHVKNNMQKYLFEIVFRYNLKEKIYNNLLSD